MDNIRAFLDTFVTKDYFIIILMLMIIILIVLVIALIKTEKKFDEELSFEMFDSLLPDTTDDDISLPNNYISEIKTFDDIIEDYEKNDEENAVISTDELEIKTKERMEELGISDNQAMIQKYEEEQEKKAIISYEQLLQNAANITITYTEESIEEGAPIINKIDIKEKEVSEAQSYLKEEEFLNILKEFRVSIQ